MNACEATGEEGWYILVMHAPRRAFDRASFRATGPFRHREEATARGRADAARDGDASVRIAYATQMPFARIIWHRAEELDRSASTGNAQR
jgi:hypothetical protein